MRAPEWTRGYVGIPFREHGRDRGGCDCWGLVRLVLGEVFGLDLPSYATHYASVADHERLAGLVDSASRAWLPVPRGRERPGDVLLLRIHGQPIHVGLIVAPGLMLHVERRTDSVLARFDGLEWRNRSLGAYRHARLAATDPVPGQAAISLAACPHPFGAARVDLAVAPGKTVAEILEIAQADPLLRRHAAVFVGDHFVPREHWHRVRPKPGSSMTVRAVPQRGEGGNKVLRTVLFIAIAAVAFQTGQLEVIAAAGPLVQGAAVATVGVLGSLAVNALVPPYQPKLDDLSGGERTSGFLSGSQNRLTPFGAVPAVLGKVRSTPPLAARPVTEVVGDDQFLRLLLLWGYGPLTMPEALKIGETPIGAFEDVEVQHVQGHGPDPRRFAPGDVDTTDDRITVPAHDFGDDHAVEVTSDGTPPGGLAANPQVFGSSDIDAADDRILLAGHGLADGQPVEFATDDRLPGGLRTEKRYFVVGATAAGFRLSTAPGGAPLDLVDGGDGAHSMTAGYFVTGSQVGDFQLSASQGGPAVDLTSGGAGRHTVRRLPERLTLFPEDIFELPLAVTLSESFQVRTTEPETDEISVDITFPAGLAQFNKESTPRPRSVTAEVQFAPSPGSSQDFAPAAVDTGADTIDLPGHGFAVDQIVDFATTGTLPGAVAVGKDYFISSVAGDVVQVSESRGGMPVDFTDQGSGIHTLTQHDWSAGALGNIFAARTLIMPAAPKSNVYREREAGTWTIRVDRVDRVIMDRFSGALSVVRGREVEAGVLAGDPPPKFDPESPVAPDVPGNKLPIARVLRQSAETAIADGLITDERRPDPTFPEFDAGDFVPAESSPRATSLDLGSGTLTFIGLATTAARSSPLRRSLRFQPPQRGQYDVRLRRTTPEATATDIVDQAVWTALRSITDADPIKATGVAMTALRIKATDQLRGSIPPINGIVQSILPDWDGLRWSAKPTNNPAAIFRAVLQGPGNARPRTDSGLDLAVLQDYSEYCVGEGWAFNHVVDYPSTVYAVLAEVAAAGRASPTLIDGRWGVVIDEPRVAPIQHFTPRNSWGFSGEKAFHDLPHGFRMRFVNEQRGYQQDEVIAYRDGFSADNATTFEGLETTGVTDPELVWRVGRYHIAVAELRPEVFTWFADLEAVVCTRGDLVLLTHDVILVGLAAGRLKQVIVDGGGDATQLVLDEVAPMEAGKSYGLSIRKDDGDNALTAAIDTDPGAQTTVTLTTPIPAAQVPGAGDLVSIATDGALPGGLAANPQTIASVDEANDRLILAGHGLIDGQVVIPTSSGKLPEGLRPGRKYIVVGAAAGDFQLSAVRNGTAIDLGGAGSGTHKIEATYAVANATPVDFQLRAKPASALVDLTSQGAGKHRVVRVIPPFDSQITTAPGMAAPAVYSVQSDGSVLAIMPDGSYASRILVTLFASQGLVPEIATIEGQFRLAGTDTPYSALPAVPADAVELSILPVLDGETYDIRLRYLARDGTPGPWGPVIGHTVLGKSVPPADVTGFSAQQNGPVVTFSWSQVPDLDLQGYEIRFGPPGIAWADADPLTQVTRGTRITTASVPPGTFDFHIRAKDNAKPGTAEGGNFSANSAIVQLTVTSALDIVEQRRERPAWAGTLSGFLRNPLTGDLNPESTRLASADVETNGNNFRGQDVFDSYVWQPVAAGSYEAPEIALAFADQVRAWADVQSVLGPGEAGLAAPAVELDSHSGGGYDGFASWTIGEVEARFFKFRVGFDFTVGLVRLKDFKPTVDVVETELRGTVTVPLGGQTVAFAERFHNIPQVIADAAAAGAALRFVRKSNVTETGFDALVVDAANADVGGTMTYSARGT